MCNKKELTNEDIEIKSDNDTLINEENHIENITEESINEPLSLHDLTGNGKDIFSTYKNKYENTMSSAVILLFFGILGIVSSLLFALDIIHVAMSTFQYIFLGAMYVVFIMYGILSFLKAKEYKKMINTENEHEVNIQKYLENNVTEELLKSFHDDSISEEENYVLSINRIIELILETYPGYDSKLIEYHVDEYLNEHF